DGGPKGRVSRDESAPRLLEARTVEVVPDPAEELLDVVSRLRIVKSVEEHSLLHRRERIEVLDSPAVGERPLHTLEVNFIRDELERSNRASSRAAVLRAFHSRIGRRREFGDGRESEQVGRADAQTQLPRS